MTPEEKEIKSIPYQTCPKCQEQGIVSKHPYIPGGIQHWNSSTSQSQFICNVCDGKKIIPQFIIQ